MRQAIMTRPGAIEFREVPAPVPGSGEVLLRIHRIGVCGSDVHVWHGQHPFTAYPVVQGHEYSGSVEAVGAGVAEVRVGMKATARPQVVCGVCPPCRRGDYHICNQLRVEGFQAPGCAQDLFVVPAERFVALPEELSYDQGALVEPTAVAAHSTGRAGDLAGRRVLVVGAGPIGNLVAQAARCRGAKAVLVSDRSAFRLERARMCGVDGTCNIRTEKLADAVARIFGGAGVDVAFEAVGAEAALDDAVQNIRKGGRLVVLGVFGQRPKVDMSIIGDREITLIGTLMYKHEDYRQAVAWIASGAVRTGALITRHFPFARYADAYHFIEAESEQSLKVMVGVN